MEKLIAYNGDKKFKAAFVKEMKTHYEADNFIHGTYWENGKGCAVGCSIHSLNEISGKRYGHSNHSVSEKIGIPQSLYRLQDTIFEGLSNGDAKKFPLDFSNAIHVGADLSKVTAQFLIWCLLDKKHGVIRNAPAEKFKDCHDAVLASAAVWQSYLKTGIIDKDAARRARRGARRARRARRARLKPTSTRPQPLP